MEISLIGKEKSHYDALECLLAFSCGKSFDTTNLANQLEQTISDWERMKGGPGLMTNLVNRYTERIKKGDLEAAKIAYLYLSPLFFFIRTLNKATRKDWRETVTACGIFCERIVRNLLQEVDLKNNTGVWNELKDSKLDVKNGRLKSILELNHFDAANLHSSIRMIYSVRNIRGPHDVPPAELLQAKMSINQCLPVYVEYLAALEKMGVPLAEDSSGFIGLFSDTTQVQPTLIFGEEITGTVPIRDLLKNVLYREGFFNGGKTSNEVLKEMGGRRYNYDDATVKNALRNLAQGKDAILTRKNHGNAFRYFERVPPHEYFRASI